MGEEFGPIPVIDLEDFPQQSKKLIEACKEWGCFRIINHNFPEKLLLDMKVVSRSLLDLPIEMKGRILDVIFGSGYLCPNEDRPLHEALGLYDVGSTNAIEAFCNQLEVSQEQRDIIKSYSHALYQLLRKIVLKLAESAGVGCDLANGWPCHLRINKYNFTEETAIGSTGVEIHSDSSFLTILQPDDSVGGLEVMNKSYGEFIAVDPLPGSLLVILGDMAAAWSNGRFYNVTHRVQCKEPATRFSIVLFLYPPIKELVEPPPEFIDSNHPRLYVPFIYEEFRKLKFSRNYLVSEGLELFRLNVSH